MQSVSTMIWTRITVSISYDDNHYTTGTSIDGTLIGTIAPGQSEPGNNVNKEVLHSPNLQNWSLSIRYSLVSDPVLYN